MAVHIKSPEEITRMRVAGRLAAEVLDFIAPHVRPGMTTGELDRLCHDYMVRRAGHHPGAAQLCAARLSALSEIDLHLGQPRRLPRRAGRQDAEARRHRQYRHHRDQGRLSRRHEPHVLRRASPRSRRAGCARSPTNACGAASRRCAPGMHLGDIGHAIQTHAERHGFSVVREFCGHGIGRKFHEEPQVLHYGRPGHRPPARSRG